MMKIAIVNYGSGNVQSILFALERLGVTAMVTDDFDQINTADKVIFPGVGHAATAMKHLTESSLDLLIPKLKQPVLGICLGMQLMCTHSEEGNTDGLGIFKVGVKQFSKAVKVPQMGWNTLQNLKSELFSGIPANEFMYSVHSYFAPLCSETIATTYYENDYSSALQKDNFYGVQFHPEKSGKAGAMLLQNFLKLSL